MLYTFSFNGANLQQLQAGVRKKENSNITLLKSFKVCRGLNNSLIVEAHFAKSYYINFIYDVPICRSKSNGKALMTPGQCSRISPALVGINENSESDCYQLTLDEKRASRYRSQWTLGLFHYNRIMSRMDG